MANALVVFLGRDQVDTNQAAWYWPLLHPEFVHCFLIVESRKHLFKIGAARGIPTITLMQTLAFADLQAYYQSMNAHVVVTETVEQYSFPLVLRTCVGLVKSFLGINSLAITPYQLFRSLNKLSRSLHDRRCKVH